MNPIPEEQTLCMVWCPETDKFSFKIQLKEKPLTRGILSMISSIYDPLGIAGPYLLEGKKILQQICVEKGRDDLLSDVQIKMWKKWKVDVQLLEGFRVDRCMHPHNCNQITETFLHHFSDASCDSEYHVIPAKRPTVPRLELTESVLSVKVSKFLKEEFDFPVEKRVLLDGFTSRVGVYPERDQRFHLFDRIKLIQENTKLNQWMYVPSKLNPADDTTRGLKYSMSPNDERWINGPEFLHERKEEWPTQPKSLIYQMTTKR